MNSTDNGERLRSHFEGTALTMAEDVGAEGYASPYRSHPLTWSAPSEPGNTYINERPIGTQQTGACVVVVVVVFTRVGSHRTYLLPDQPSTPPLSL